MGRKSGRERERAVQKWNIRVTANHGCFKHVPERSSQPACLADHKAIDPAEDLPAWGWILTKLDSKLPINHLIAVGP